MGVPAYIGSGQIQTNEKLRFMVMERFGTDLQKLFEQNNKRFKRKTVCCLALQIVSNFLSYVDILLLDSTFK